MNKIAILLIYAAVSACTSNELSANSKIYLKNETLFFDGRIDEKNSNTAINFINRKSIKEIIITSAGGDANSALTLANLIQKKNISIKVEKYCMSACASILFLAADNRTVNRNSLVAFHTTLSGNKQSILRSSLKTYFTIPESDVQRETDLFIKRGISLNIIDKADDVLVLRCVGIAAKSTSRDMKNARIGWAYSAWTLSRNQMSQLGVKNIEGYWPNSQVEFDRLLRRYFGANFFGRFVSDLAGFKEYGGEVPSCPQG